VELPNLAVEMFVGQKRAFEMRLESLKQNIQKLVPDSELCVFSENGFPIFPLANECDLNSFLTLREYPISDKSKIVGLSLIHI